MLVLVYWIDLAIHISLYFQLEEESETSNNLEYGCLKIYTSLLMCVVDAFHVNLAVPVGWVYCLPRLAIF